MNYHFLQKKYLISIFLFLTKISPSYALDTSKCDLVGIYIKSPYDIDSIDKMITKDVNCVVIDIKDDRGIIPYDLECEAIESFSKIKISDILAKLKKRNIYTIARIVSFKDKKKVKEKKSWAICNKNGTVYIDKEKMSWLNPYNKDVQKYLIKLGKLAAKAGFDEIQYDYVRFSTYKSLNKTLISENIKAQNKVEIINEFLIKATESIHKKGKKISVDVFGCIIPDLFYGWDENAKILGQDYEKMINIVDYVCPMIYPSHFPINFMSMNVKKVYPTPDLQPYEIICEALSAPGDTKNIDKKKIRPWLQGFTANYLQKGKWKKYTSIDIQAQINAITENGLTQCCIWNSRGNYLNILD